MNIRKLLIANRGEIALRIMLSARKMNIECGVIFTDEEHQAKFVREADSSYSLGTGPLSETYLNIAKIISIASENGFNAIHPGYGFLSENSFFAKACVDAGIIFVGPTPLNIKLMSNKLESRRFVDSIGIPLIDSVSGDSVQDLAAKAEGLGFPLMVKAAAGGGGKGMRIVKEKKELIPSIEAAKREALAYFGNDLVYIEKYIEAPRHIEVQIMADSHGNLVHLYDRECSIQRRHQKIVEEAPSPTLSAATRTAMHAAALKVARKMDYTNAGTVEFLVDSHQNFYFLEMNTRIQVEHRVTEAITGIDIVREQIFVAAGKSLSFKQDEIVAHGHAIECRVYAEDAFLNFLPSAGEILFSQLPKINQVQVDTEITESAQISSDFDPMIAKVVTHCQNREQARKKMLTALSELVVHGITTNIDYLQEVLSHERFIANDLSINFCEVNGADLSSSYRRKCSAIPLELIVASYLFRITGERTEKVQNVWNEIGFWRNYMTAELTIFDTLHTIRFRKPSSGVLLFSVDNSQECRIAGNVSGKLVHILVDKTSVNTFVTLHENLAHVTVNGATFTIVRNDFIRLNETNALPKAGMVAGDEVKAPLFGKVINVNVMNGDIVKSGDLLFIIESMKMENNVLATRDGKVDRVLVAKGDKVASSELLLTFFE